jgi:hypothetical protein
MEYNTTRNHLILPEYGRNVQNMIAHAKELVDRSERNRAVQAIIEVMGQLNPHLRDVDDYRHKLWTHLFVMANFDLDVDTPYEIPKPEVLNEKPEWMEYPKSNIKYGHYGKYTPMILETAKTTEDPNEKEYLKNSMANFMKKQYLSHNNDAVENNVIAGHLKELSDGELILENPDELVNTNTILRSMGIGPNNNNNNKKFGKKPNFKQKQNQNQKQKFKKQ